MSQCSTIPIFWCILIKLSLVMLCFLPQEYIDNPLYLEQVQVQVPDKPKRSANTPPAAADKVHHQFNVTPNVFPIS